MRRMRIGLLKLIVVAFLGSAGVFPTTLCGATPAELELREIRREMDAARSERFAAKRSDLSEAELNALNARFAARETKIRQRYLKLANDSPGTKAELFALYAVAGKWPKTVEGKHALHTLTRVLETANLTYLGETFESLHASHKQSMRPLIPVLLRRERENSDHPYAAKLLTEACLFAAPNDNVSEAPDDFVVLADVIVERHAASPKLANFCEQIGGIDWSPLWAHPFEPHLRRILEVNKDRFVRCSAKIALASIVQESGELRQPEAEGLFVEFLAEFDGSARYHASSIEKMYRERAKRSLEVIRSHGLGKLAPETVGIDLNNEPMTLEDYRGKVVLVSFWATWCFPCMKMIPHEKQLVERFASEEFAIVGINGDKDVEVAREAVKKHRIPWRSFQHDPAGKDRIVDQWHVAGWPTFYLLDINGVVRKRWIGEPALDDLSDSVERLIESPAKGLQSARREAHSDVPRRYAPVNVAIDKPGATGFVAKTIRSNGKASKYVVFIPRNYNPETFVPAILFLHGAGLEGTDGRKQLTGALANAIRQRRSFPFIAVFPQAHQGNWQATSPSGKRAMAILDEVSVNYSVDTSRVFLTGLSMGGEGTWSLAAAYPDRWAAIVPICGGGDPSIAHRIKDIPCWCFHGAADRVIQSSQSRRMVEAIRRAGGQPTYHEYPGVGHNCWDRTYARDELYEWLLLQERS